jgi:hypothetical protein
LLEIREKTWGRIGSFYLSLFQLDKCRTKDTKLANLSASHKTYKKLQIANVILRKKHKDGAGGMAQVVEHWPSKHKALNLKLTKPHLKQ